jgi:hypothetical protein
MQLATPPTTRLRCRDDRIPIAGSLSAVGEEDAAEVRSARVVSRQEAASEMNLFACSGDDLAKFVQQLKRSHSCPILAWPHRH